MEKHLHAMIFLCCPKSNFISKSRSRFKLQSDPEIYDWGELFQSTLTSQKTVQSEKSDRVLGEACSRKITEKPERVIVQSEFPKTLKIRFFKWMNKNIKPSIPSKVTLKRQLIYIPITDRSFSDVSKQPGRHSDKRSTRQFKIYTRMVNSNNTQ